MATQYAGANLGDEMEDVTFGTASTTKNVEITFDDTVILERQQIAVIIEQIMAAIERKDTFPAA